MTLPRTPSQTVGPFFSIELMSRAENALVADGVELAGTVYDGEGAPVPDALVELWDGERWGRCGTDANGRFSFIVAKPAPRPGEAPSFDVLLFARGLLRHQLTRVYFPDEPAANGADPVLAALSPGDRSRLVAAQDGAGLRFDIRMQGEHATVFFDV